MKLYFKFLSIHIKSAMQYKVSFAMLTLGQLLTSFSSFVTIWFLLGRFGSVGGWELGEVMLCFAVSLLSFSVAECFFRGFDTFQSILGNGVFDRILVRPKNVIAQVLFQRIELSRLGRFVQGMITLAIAIPAAGIHWSAAKIATLLLMLAGCTAIFSGLLVLHASFCFFTTEALEVMNIFTDGSREFTRYPLNIYGRELLTFYTLVIPLACVQYYPLLYLTGRSSLILYPLLPLAGFVFLVPCYLFWKLGVRHYKSTGS